MACSRKAHTQSLVTQSRNAQHCPTGRYHTGAVSLTGRCSFTIARHHVLREGRNYGTKHKTPTQDPIAPTQIRTRDLMPAGSHRLSGYWVCHPTPAAPGPTRQRHDTSRTQLHALNQQTQSRYGSKQDTMTRTLLQRAARRCLNTQPSAKFCGCGYQTEESASKSQAS